MNILDNMTDEENDKILWDMAKNYLIQNFLLD
jgi:hypothetical protein